MKKFNGIVYNYYPDYNIEGTEHNADSISSAVVQTYKKIFLNLKNRFPQGFYLKAKLSFEIAKGEYRSLLIK